MEKTSDERNKKKHMKELGSFEVSAVAVIVVQKRLQVSRNITIMCVYVKEMTSTFTSVSVVWYRTYESYRL